MKSPYDFNYSIGKKDANTSAPLVNFRLTKPYFNKYVYKTEWTSYYRITAFGMHFELGINHSVIFTNKVRSKLLKWIFG